MKAVVVYESHWGNTEAIARAIAEGIGPDAVPLTTDEARPELIADADLVVAGAPVLGFSLPTERMVEGLVNQSGAPPADVAHAPLRTWLDSLPAGRALHAAFETRIKWSPGGATGAIGKAFEEAGYPRASDAQKYVVKGKFGPLRDGELERARAWGAELAAVARSRSGAAPA